MASALYEFDLWRSMFEIPALALPNERLENFASDSL